MKQRKHTVSVCGDAQELFQKALQLERRGLFARAFALFSQLQNHPPADQGDLFFHLGWCTEQDTSGNDREAIRYYQQAASHSKIPLVRVNAHFRAGWIFMHLGAQEKALQAFQQALSEALQNELTHHPLFADAGYWYAISLEKQGRYLDARAWYQKIAPLFPSFQPECWFRLIHCCIQVGAFEQALAYCLKFTRPAPPGFDADRYQYLQAQVEVEKNWLQHCLNDAFLQDELR